MKRLPVLLLLTVLAHCTFAQPADPDSLHRLKVIAGALRYTALHRHTPFHCQMEDPFPEDSAEVGHTDLHYGHLFSDRDFHLIVTIEYGTHACIAVYRERNGHFKRVISDDQDMELLANGIRDIDGDGHKDFLTHWYPMSGCCRRNVYFVYLYRPLSGTFTRAYVFMNPTFSPREKVIRGVKYGQPGETPLYKYRWNGLRVDTVEYIYSVHRGGVAYLKTRKDSFGDPGPKDGVPLKSVPAEYRHIGDYAWFPGGY